MVVEILEFDLGGESYAMDIGIAREIVEMLPITPIPRAPSHVTGLLNLRGEITTIINLHHLLGISPAKEREEQKIMVLIPDAFENTSVGVIVDEVHSVLTIDEKNIDTNIRGVDEQLTDYVQGIIKLGEDDSLKTEDESVTHESEKRLIIWVDVKKILTGTIESSSSQKE
ncbi:chemotaxis protein CheW [Methanospirillum stamsii]|uniref:Chemotaxis protein CheW n=1 Tax=Methanospirillum stamsii TaxID=1277351 RepID=A0A2V2N6R3_9EURY|nr:chemotaxis protein CheW [Methanospirillum stamsii]PWR71211.1 chemotaxis protein CheW [Methanospirillum stamsii]